MLVSTALRWGHEAKWDLGLGSKRSCGKTEQAHPECERQLANRQLASGRGDAAEKNNTAKEGG